MDEVKFNRLVTIISEKLYLLSDYNENINKLDKILLEIKEKFKFDTIFLFFEYKSDKGISVLKKEIVLNDKKSFEKDIVDKILNFLNSYDSDLIYLNVKDKNLNDYFLKNGFKFYLIIPIKTKFKTSGFLLFLDKSEISYQNLEIEILKVLSIILSNIFEIYVLKTEQKEHEKMDRIIFDNLEELVTFQDKDLRLITVNKRAADSVNMKIEDLVGRKCHEIWHKRDTPCENCPVVKSMKSLKKEEGVITSYDGRIWYIKANPVLNDNGELLGVIETTLEITEKTLFEERFKTIFNQTSVGLTITDKNGDVVLINPARCKMLGYSEEELLKMNFRDYIYEDDLPKDLENYEKLINGKINSYKLDLRVKRKDGTIGWNRIYVSRVSDLNNNFLYSISLVEDITKEKEFEERTVFQERRLRAMFNQTSVGINIVDKNGKIIECNKAWRDMIGYSQEELKNMKWTDYTHPEDIKINENFFKGALLGKIDSYILEKRFIRKDGKIFWGKINSSAIRDEKGETQYFITLIEDINERKEKEIELKERDKRLEELLNQIIISFSRLIELKEYYTYGHQKRVSELGVLVAKKMGLSDDNINCVKFAGLLHDIGKIELPLEILNKPGKLTSNEYEIVKLHPYYGYEILKNIRFPWPIAEVVYQHQERIDGSGYPRGLKGDEILLEAKILSVCDVIEAMTSHRTYRPKLPIEMVIKELKENRGKLYDEKVVDTVLMIFEENDYNLSKIFKE